MSSHLKTSPLMHLSNLFTTENRFESDFETIEKIGSGGFASVYKVRNLIDDSLYAIKKIKVDIEKNYTKGQNLQKELEKVLQEIRYLAKIKSEYIVTYNHSWIEVLLRNGLNDDDSRLGFDSEDNSNKSIFDSPNKQPKSIEGSEEDEFSYEIQYESMDGIVEFIDEKTPHNSNKQKEEESKKKNKSKSKGKSFNVKEEIEFTRVQSSDYSSEKIKFNNIEYNINQIDKLIIYIQMEYCKSTLGDYIETRNNALSSSSTNLYPLDSKSILESIKVFLTVTKGIDFIHSNQGMIHRDIKPNNILFTMDDKVKIGDFGLATQSRKETNKVFNFMIPSPILKTKNEPKKHSKAKGLNLLGDNENETGSFNPSYVFGEIISPIQTDKNLVRIDGGNVVRESIKRLKNIDNLFRDEMETLEEKKGRKKEKGKKKQINDETDDNFHTREVGTTMYSAPEQMNGNLYDQKADIYSLGLVLFELVYPLVTSMERSYILSDLKNKRKIPSSLIEYYPALSKLVLEMTELDPKRRPTAKEIVDIVESELITDFKFNEICSSSSPTTVNSRKEGKSFEIKKKKDEVESCKTRLRVLSEDLFSIPAREFKMKSCINDSWKKIWVKLINDKLLIYNKQNSKKADIVYDIKECEVKGHKYIKETNKTKKTLNTLSTNRIMSTRLLPNMELNPNLESKKSVESPVKRSKSPTEVVDSNNPYSSNNLNNERVVELEDDVEISIPSLMRRTQSAFDCKNLEKKLNDFYYQDQEELHKTYRYEIEIEHPYLNSFCLRGEHTEEVFKFYEQLKLIENN